MNYHKLLTNKYFNYFCIIFSISTLSVLFWFRFIIPRLPKEIPFNLNFLSVLFLCSISLGNIFIIIKIFRESKDNLLIQQISSIIIHPFIILDRSIKNNVFIKPVFEKYFIVFFKVVKDHHVLLIYIEYTIQIVCIMCLVSDIFYYRKIFYLYRVMWLYIIIYLAKYILFTMKSIREEQSVLINKKCQIHLSNAGGSVISLDYLIAIQIDDLMNKRVLSAYSLNFLYNYLVEEAQKVVPMNRHINTNHLRSNTRNMINLVRNIAFFQHNYYNEKKKIVMLQVILSGVKIICWSYILLKSLHTLPEDFISSSLPNDNNPFDNSL